MKVLWMVLALLCEMAVADRRLLVPPFPRRLVLNNPNPANPALTAGSVIHVSLFLTNPGLLPQTGAVSMLPGTSGYGSYVGTNVSFDRHLYVCTSTDAAGATSGGAGAPGLPRAVRFNLGANQTVRVTIGMWLRQSLSVSTPLIDTEFSPNLLVRVDQDRGALLASAIPQIDGATIGTACDGTNFSANRDFAIPNERSGNPLFINGGRAF